VDWDKDIRVSSEAKPGMRMLWLRSLIYVSAEYMAIERLRTCLDEVGGRGLRVCLRLYVLKDGN
jgi:hypothetical protein